MYPTFEILSVKFYTFGVILSCTWLLFFILLHKFSLERGIIRPVFSDIIKFTVSLFFFSRVLYILSDWLDEKFILMELFSGNFIAFLKLFFIPQNYLFSLFGAIIGFFLVFLTKTHEQKKDRGRYLDAIVYAFFYASILGYFGSLLGGQVYGIPFSSPISITYNHIDSIVKDRAPLFPLAIFYMIIITIALVVLKKIEKKKVLPDGCIGYIGMSIFFFMVFLGEFLSGTRKDILYDYFGLSLNQGGALIGLIIAVLGIIRIIKKETV